jgi:hypothetical protein
MRECALRLAIPAFVTLALSMAACPFSPVYAETLSAANIDHWTYGRHWSPALFTAYGKPDLEGDTMCADSLSVDDFKNFQDLLALVIARAHSIGEIEAWLQSQERVKLVKVEAYLLKSNPPQREIIIEFESKHGKISRKTVSIFDIRGSEFKLNKIYDAN